MEGLVTIKNKEAVTDSLTLANAFNKQHKDILRDIRCLDCSEEFSRRNFALSNYHLRGKEYPHYYITQDGFSYLAMGYTGKKAALFKEKYIEAFNKMRKYMENGEALSDKDRLIASIKLTLHNSEEIALYRNKVLGLEDRFNNELTLSHGQAAFVSHTVKKRVEKLWNEGVVGSLESKKQMYSLIYSQMRRAFQAPTYREVKRKNYDDAVSWISTWRPL